jgi:hypothetical protein
MGQTNSPKTLVSYQKKNRRRVKTQNSLYNITTEAEALNHKSDTIERNH